MPESGETGAGALYNNSAIVACSHVKGQIVQETWKQASLNKTSAF